MELRHFNLFAAPVGPRQVSRHGAPAACVPYDGMPAYENARILVMECLLLFIGAEPRSLPVALPFSYGMVALRAPSGLAALHDDPDAAWTWRPLLYDLKLSQTQRRGSQQELGWRIGVHQAQLAGADTEDVAHEVILAQLVELKRRYGWVPPVRELRKNARKRLYRDYAARVAARERPPLPFVEANRRAAAILREHLSEQQRLELAARGYFYVRGTLNPLYRVEPGNGAAICDPLTRAPRESLCIHTDEWIPDDDNALAAKMLIESGRDGEAELLEGARPRLTGAKRRAASAADRRAWRMERDLLPAPLA